MTCLNPHFKIEVIEKNQHNFEKKSRKLRTYHEIMVIVSVIFFKKQEKRSFMAK